VGNLIALVDGAFFVAAYSSNFGRYGLGGDSASEVAERCVCLCAEHAERLGHTLESVTFYDAPPLEKQAHNPLSGALVDFATLPESRFRRSLHAALSKLDGVTVELGTLAETTAGWRIREAANESLLRGKLSFDQIRASHLYYDVEQKGVDVALAARMVELACRRPERAVLLLSADADFAPAVRFAVGEGVEVVLDTMGLPARAELLAAF
jgi:uncharacterized LabA/DUF88 family protein